MIKRLYLYPLTLFISFNATAKDFGVVAPTFPIIEQHFISYIHKRLEHLKETGRLGELEQEMKETVKEQVLRPQVAVNFPTTTEPKSYLVDPSLTLAIDIKDHKGNVIYPKGLTINPFDPSTFPNRNAYQINFSKRLIFLDGDDAAQVDWLKRHLETETMPTKIILTNGVPTNLENEIDQRVYFEQTGDMARKFHISHLPVTINQDGKNWRVTEHDPYQIKTIGVMK
ncbi:type-F conjugative transfer system protein TraW [Photobacterium makurazakiensis]|uniref:type-F conjugative transfer system protein TraW n=1 Tax=Photobacterium makurazakiensis TaxID=2910234 RepID=UPI003D11CA56